MTTKLVMCEDRSIHSAGCKDSEKRGMYPEPFAEDFEGSTIKELAQWWIADWYENTGELDDLHSVHANLLDEVKPCTKLKR